MSKERLVDVKADERVLHTFPVTVSGEAQAGEDGFKAKALEAAANAHVLPGPPSKHVSAEMHVSRGGPLEPYGDTLGVLAETPEGLQQTVRDRAYFLWEMAGRPDGRTTDFWFQARHQHLCERAYMLWEREGCPPNNDEKYWFLAIQLEQS